MDDLAPLLKGRLPATKPSWGGRRGKKSRAKPRRWCVLRNPGRILFLPDEILLLIFSALDYITAIALTKAHIRFWHLVDPRSFYSAQQKISDIMYAHANFPRFKGRFSCHGCFRILTIRHFSVCDRAALKHGSVHRPCFRCIKSSWRY